MIDNRGIAFKQAYWRRIIELLPLVVDGAQPGIAVSASEARIPRKYRTEIRRARSSQIEFYDAEEVADIASGFAFARVVRTFESPNPRNPTAPLVGDDLETHLANAHHDVVVDLQRSIEREMLAVEPDSKKVALLRSQVRQRLDLISNLLHASPPPAPGSWTHAISDGFVGVHDRIGRLLDHLEA
ncbi:MAG: hypothetical protein IH942_08680 [Acidobacteria bacterium]|nr:hypothetical protein [Acidobacteriota bacterium]